MKLLREPLKCDNTRYIAYATYPEGMNPTVDSVLIVLEGQEEWFIGTKDGPLCLTSSLKSAQRFIKDYYKRKRS